jgi:predicted secreted protein
MEQKSLSGVQSLIQKINSCKNPREGRAWLYTLRNKVKEVGYGNLDKDSMESITIIEKSRGDSNRRVSKMKAFNSGFDGISRDYTTLVKGIKSRNLYSASDVAQLFQKQISS